MRASKAAIAVSLLVGAFGVQSAHAATIYGWASTNAYGQGITGPSDGYNANSLFEIDTGAASYTPMILSGTNTAINTSDGLSQVTGASFQSMVSGSDGTLYAVDSNNGAIYSISVSPLTSTASVSVISNGFANGGTAYGLAISGSSLYVSVDGGTSPGIYTLPTSGGAATQFLAQSDTIRGIAISGSTLYEADASGNGGSGSINQVNLTTKNVIVNGYTGDAYGPKGISSGASYVYVVTSNSNGVGIVDAASGSGEGGAYLNNTPEGVYYSPTDNEVYVGSDYHSNLAEFSPSEANSSNNNIAYTYLGTNNYAASGSITGGVFVAMSESLPEPASVGLLAIGSFALLMRRSRKTA